MMKNDKICDTLNHNLSWNYYLNHINSTDSFKTRYLHYLRWRSVLQSLNIILKYVKTDAKTALDIGCNRGYYSSKLGDFGLKVDAVDLILTPSRISNSNIMYFEDDFLKWIPPRKYDLIMAMEVYEHILPSERGLFLEKIVTALNSGGVLLFSGPNCISLHYGLGYVKYRMKNFSKEEIDWHYRIPYMHYDRILRSYNLNVVHWHTNSIFPIFSNKFERVFDFISPEVIFGFEYKISRLFNGFGANYYALLKKGDDFDR